MSEPQVLPPGWEEVKIKDITHHGGTRVPQGDETFWYIDIDAVDNKHQIIASPKELLSASAPSRARMIVRSGDVIFSLVRPYLKNIALIPENLDNQIASTAFCVLHPEADIEGSFLYYVLLRDSLIDSIPTYGSSPPAARDEEFLSLSIPLPPLAEQRRIVASIEQQFTRLDAGIASLQQAQARLRRYRAAVLKAAVEGHLTAAWRAMHPDTEPAETLLVRMLTERRTRWEDEQRAKGKDPTKLTYDEPTLPDTATLPALPEGWTWCKLEHILPEDPQNGLYLPQSKYSKGIAILRIDDFQNGCSKSSDQMRQVDASNDDIARYSLYEEDLIINRVNSLTHLGKNLLIQERNLPSVFESNMMRLRLSHRISPTYIALYLRSELGRNYLTCNAKWAVNQASINQTDVKNTSTPLPPLAEQEQIVAEVERRLSVVSEVEAEVLANLKRAERLRQSILREAFAGRLVAQDPADESASVLLERIRTKREKEISIRSRPQIISGLKPRTKSAKRSLYEILKSEKEGQLRPEQLFVEAGYTISSIESFYGDLAIEMQLGRVGERTISDTDKRKVLFARYL